MYFATVILLLIVLPLAFVVAEAYRSDNGVGIILLVGRWFVFWAVGIRLSLAGIRQVVQPRFSAEEIFGIKEPTSLAIVRELGFANLSMGARNLDHIPA
jgi:hypothetical protein